MAKATTQTLLVGVLCTASLLAAASAEDGPTPTRIPDVALGPAELEPDAVGIGRQIRDLALRDQDGRATQLSAHAGTNGTVIVVRDPDCPVSRRYGPRIAELAQHYARLGFSFVMLYPNVSIDGALRAQDRSTLKIPGLYVERGSFALADALGVTSTGDTFVLDAALRLRYRSAVDDQFGVGYTRPLPTRHHLRNALDDLVAGRSVATPATSAPGCHIDADPAFDRWFDTLPDGHLVSHRLGAPQDSTSPSSRIVASNISSDHRMVL